MAKKEKESKDTVEVKANDVAETAPVEKSVTVSRITTEAQAQEHLKEFTVPAGNKIAFVTEDRNVFWHENESSAVNHAERNNLKLFRIECQD